LKHKVDRLLASPLVKSPLLAKGIEIVEVTAPKQTETTQRWKAGLRTIGGPIVRTKIEFSRRGAIDGAAFEPVVPSVLLPGGLPPFLAPHYATRAAIVQKVRALADRTEPQARDVFDLGLLLSRPEGAMVGSSDVDPSLVTRAIDRAIGISFDDYTSTVVAYLDPELAPPYAERDAWSLMQETVVRHLERIAEGAG